MKKVFWDDPYLTKLQTNVAAVQQNNVVFEQTIAFSFCGGQESDLAYVNKIEVIDSKIAGNLIIYTLPQDHRLKVGDEVIMEINWDRRYRLMRLHFAAELILELCYKYFSLDKIGAHITQNKARIDFIYPKNISVTFDKLLVEYNQIIQQNLSIKTGFSDEATQRRYWEIKGFSKVACGGTHVKSTGEVGLIELKRVNIGKNKERIEIILN